MLGCCSSARRGSNSNWTRTGNCSRSALSQFDVSWCLLWSHQKVDLDIGAQCANLSRFAMQKLLAIVRVSSACWFNFNESTIPCLVLILKLVFYLHIKVSVAGALSVDNDTQDTGSTFDCLREETSTGNADCPSLETIWHKLALLLLGVGRAVSSREFSTSQTYKRSWLYIKICITIPPGRLLFFLLTNSTDDGGVITL